MATIGSIIMFVASIALLIFWIQILIVAFKTHIGWGLGSLFIPFVGLVFVFMHWQKTKTPFLRSLICVAVQIVAAGISYLGVSG
ncbi:MAG: hypothetical protein K8R59_15140 [Thermoanaerobaculales bacterium]|nr:hypothetical protein [Thermoanaerobaculales bacterium]